MKWLPTRDPASGLFISRTAYKSRTWNAHISRHGGAVVVTFMGGDEKTGGDRQVLQHADYSEFRSHEAATSWVRGRCQLAPPAFIDWVDDKLSGMLGKHARLRRGDKC